jgi:23S rRNA (guanosine2251-2'-O)-methyltransferase
MHRPKETTFIYGIRAVIEAIRAGKQIDKVLFQSGLRAPMVGELRKEVKQFNIPTQNVPVNKLNFLTQKSHQGVIAFLSPIEFQELDQLIPSLYDQGKTPFILALDRVTDVRNFGAICRTAECAGVDAVLVSAKGMAAINADAVKSSAGALLKVPICRTSSLLTGLQYLKDSGLQIIACTEKTDALIYQGKYDDPIAIVLGSEESGISRDIITLADQCIKIPLEGDIESLNVSVAAGIVLYEALRQRKSHG